MLLFCFPADRRLSLDAETPGRGDTVVASSIAIATVRFFPRDLIGCM